RAAHDEAAAMLLDDGDDLRAVLLVALRVGDLDLRDEIGGHCFAPRFSESRFFSQTPPPAPSRKGRGRCGAASRNSTPPPERRSAQPARIWPAAARYGNNAPACSATLGYGEP